MRRSISLAVAAGIASLAIGSVAGAETARERDLLGDPVVLTGSRFKAHEAVRVTVRAGTRTLTRDIHAGTRGGFTVTFRVKVNFCSRPLSIMARGAASGTARAPLPRPVCVYP